MKYLALCLLFPSLSLAADPAPKTEAPKAEAKPKASGLLQTDDQKTLYMLGYVLGNKTQPLSITAAESKYVEAGFKDGMGGKKPQVDTDVYGPKLNELAQARTAKAREAADKEAAKTAQSRKDSEKAFYDKAAGEKGVEKLPSGVLYKEVKAGSGKKPTADDTVKVHYEGKLVDGTVFDSSIKRGEPIEFPLKGVIPCWTEGVQKMKVGGKAQLVCPSDTAYGDRGAGGAIPPGATLIFDVELLDIPKK